jgi:translation initiation factor 2 subunit 1
MQSLKKSSWPERGELVLATVKKVLDYGVYVALEEYGNKEGLLHRNEISTSWVRNIRNHVREGQKLVLKVLRVNPNKKHIDLSRKRVSRRDRIDKLYTFKHERKAETLLRLAAEKLGKPLEEIAEKAAVVMEENYGGIYPALEEASRNGPEPLTKIGIPKEIAQVLAEFAQEKIPPQLVEVKGILRLTSSKADGVSVIMEALGAAKKMSTSKNAKIHIHTIAAPKYLLRVEAENYKEAETVIERASEKAIQVITAAGGKGDFEREK